MSTNPNVQAILQLLQADTQTLSTLTHLVLLSDQERRGLLRLYRQLHQDPKLQATLHQITKEPQLNALVKEIAKITPDPNVPSRTKEDTYDRIMKFVETISRHDQISTNSHGQMLYQPKLKRHEMILVKFAGQGAELHDIHYGIVWDVSDSRDQVVVIPTGSFKYPSTRENKYQFNIGKVGFFPEDTLVRLVGITSISRKRILTNRMRDPKTGLHQFVYLNPEQIQRIQYGLHAMVYGQESLFEYIRKSNRIPILAQYDIQFEHMHRSFKIEPGTTPDVLRYRVLGDTRIYQIERKETTLSRGVRDKLLFQWINATGRDAQHRIQNQKKVYQQLIQKTR